LINICFVIDTIESPTAGTEKQLLLLIEHLSRSHFRPYLSVLRSSKWLKEQFHGCETYCADIPSFKTTAGWKGVWRLQKFLKNKQIDVIQVHFRDAGIAGILAGRIAGRKKIIATRRNQGYWMNGRELLVQKILNRFVACFVANSISTKNWAARIEGISPDRINVIYNAIELEPFLACDNNFREQNRKKLNISKDAFVVGIVANLRPVKAIDVFLKAAAIVNEKINNACFLIVGDGLERNRLENLAVHLGIKDDVLFLGRKENIPQILSTFNIGVLSSKSESLPNAVLEYLASGLPIVCTEVGGIRELITSSQYGHIVPVDDPSTMADAIETIFNKKKQCLASGVSIIIRENFNIQKVIEQYENLYKSI
jgi:glycosyltransferase involved in cell wall biosynthesis